MKTYTVTIAQVIYTYQDVKVQATSEEEAERIGMEIVWQSDNWKFASEDTFVNGITQE